MKYLAAIIGLVLMSSACADVKSEIVEMPSLCGPMRELEAFILHPIEGVHCMWMEKFTALNVNHDAAVGLLAD